MPGILVGYARTSTCEQQAELDAQVRDLKAAGYEEIFSEQVSAVAQRDRLREALRLSVEVTHSWPASRIALPGVPRTCCVSWTTLIAVASV